MNDEKVTLDTYSEKTWCPGCSNFAVLTALKQTIQEMIATGTPKENIVVVGGIGCSSKSIDYLDVNTFSALHGRTIAVAEGIKIANPKLEVIVCAGDGGTYNEGISHLIYATKRNVDITVFVFNNRTFALTTGQFTATSPTGYRGKSTPEGTTERPFNPLEIALAANATFLARAYGLEMDSMKRIMKKAVEHKGFSLVDILVPCISFFKEDYKDAITETPSEKLESKEEALRKISKWSYTKEKSSIPIGIFYQKKETSFL